MWKSARAARWRRVLGDVFQLGEMCLCRWCAGNAGRADKIEMRRRFVFDGQVRDERRSLLDYLDGWLRNSGVSDVANLAVIFVVGVAVPVANCVSGKESERQNGRHG